jgi:hypothetical protein
MRKLYAEQIVSGLISIKVFEEDLCDPCEGIYESYGIAVNALHMDASFKDVARDAQTAMQIARGLLSDIFSQKNLSQLISDRACCG